MLLLSGSLSTSFIGSSVGPVEQRSVTSPSSFSSSLSTLLADCFGAVLRLRIGSEGRQSFFIR